MTELTATWVSLSRIAPDEPAGIAFADDVLVKGWQNAPDKGRYVDALPPREAARLCDLLNAGQPRGRAVLGRAPRRK
jgi:hypothetical protein